MKKGWRDVLKKLFICVYASNNNYEIMTEKQQKE